MTSLEIGFRFAGISFLFGIFLLKPGAVGFIEEREIRLVNGSKERYFRGYSMLNKLKHITFRPILFAVMLLVGIPCSIKREVKLALGIPVSNTENGTKVHKTGVCQFLAEKTPVSQTSESEQIRDAQRYPFASYRSAIKPVLALCPQYPDEAAPRIKVRIHLLHEQYLI